MSADLTAPGLTPEAFREEDCDLWPAHYRPRGGQHVGMTPSDVTARHRPTGIAITCADHRSQLRNKRDAMRKLKELVELSARLTALEAENERLTARVAELSTPDIFGISGNNDTATPELDELADHLNGPGSVAEIWQNRDMGIAWLAIVRVPVEGCDDEWEPRVFPTKAEALAAVAHAKSESLGEHPREVTTK